MFMKDLRLLVLDCEYHDADDIIADDIIIDNHCDSKVQERLLDVGDELTLARAVRICQQRELTQKQIKIVRDEDAVTSLSVLQKDPCKPRRRKPKFTVSPQGTASATNTKVKAKSRPQFTKKCRTCGRDPSHPWNKGKCPALGSTCSYCKRPNHWLAVCRERKDRVHTVDYEENYEPDDVWNETLYILDTPVTFRIDTGAKCNTLTADTYQKLPHDGELRASRRVIRSYTNHTLKPLAAVDLAITHRTKIVDASFEIVNVIQENVLSGHTAIALGLIARISSLDNNKPENNHNDSQVSREYPELDRNTGTLPGEYSIKLQEGAVGVVHAVRRQPAALRARIIAKLREMERDRFIERVEQPAYRVGQLYGSSSSE
jgi:hypothetical protein